MKKCIAQCKELVIHNIYMKAYITVIDKKEKNSQG